MGTLFISTVSRLSVVRPVEKEGLVAGVGVLDLPRARIDGEEAEGGEMVHVDLAGDAPVDPVEEGGRVLGGVGDEVEDGAHHDHDEAGGDALAGHVADGHDGPVGPGLDDVVVVGTDPAGRAREDAEGEPPQLGQLLGHEGALDLLGDVGLPLDVAALGRLEEGEGVGDRDGAEVREELAAVEVAAPERPRPALATATPPMIRSRTMRGATMRAREP